MEITIPDKKIAEWKKQIEEHGYDFSVASKKELQAYVISMLDEEFDMDR